MLTKEKTAKSLFRGYNKPAKKEPRTDVMPAAEYIKTPSRAGGLIIYTSLRNPKDNTSQGMTLCFPDYSMHSQKFLLPELYPHKIINFYANVKQRFPFFLKFRNF